jgi:chromosome segregation ATPase
MKKSLILLGFGAIMLASCSGNSEKLAEDSARIAELSAEYAEANSFNDSLMLLMGDIYTGLDSINMQEGLLYNMGSGENVDRRAEIRQNLANIKARLAANKALLDQMEGKLKAKGDENGVLTKTIAQLKDRISKQDAKIAQLENDLTAAKGQIEELNTKVAEGQQQVEAETAAKEAAQAQATAVEDAANTVYYAIGTNKELKQNGLLEKKFLGQTKVLKGDFNESYFTKADKRSLSVIPTGAKKIKIWTNMPEGSYTEDKNADGTITLRITNPKEFWSMTTFLVIQTN